MKGWRYVRSLGLGGSLCGGLAGLVFIVCQDKFSGHAAFDDVLLVGLLLGAAGQRLLAAFVFEPLQFYARLLQVTLLGPLIKERLRDEIIEELALRYFLGERRVGHDAGQGPAADTLSVRRRTSRRAGLRRRLRR